MSHEPTAGQFAASWVTAHVNANGYPSGFVTFVDNRTVDAGDPPTPTNTDDGDNFVGVDTDGVVAVTCTLVGAEVVAAPRLSVTVTVKVMLCGYTKSGAAGTTNVGFTTVDDDNVTGTPPVCVHW
jgi:hypothetical protein